MAKRKATSSRSGPVVYVALIVVLYLLGSLTYALATDNSACGRYNDQKEWRLVPPGWDCPSTPF